MNAPAMDLVLRLLLAPLLLQCLMLGVDDKCAMPKGESSCIAYLCCVPNKVLGLLPRLFAVPDVDWCDKVCG